MDTFFPVVGHSAPVRAVRVWLWLGLVLVLGQIAIGGITRLTGSGLSITKWEIVIGAIPPLNDADWQHAFDLYRNTPQYHKINKGMSLTDFKFIYFWEYFHRLWARSMGLIFLFPYLYFRFRGRIPAWLNKRLFVVILIAALAAAFGWIMVASGLIHRPWVNAYKLSIHLGIGFTLFAYLLWTILMCYPLQKTVIHNNLLKTIALVIIVILCCQIFFGGLMSGMKAALLYPTFPDMNGMYIPYMLFDSSNWTWQNFEHYDTHPFAPTLIQFLHRTTAYILTIIGLYFYVKSNMLKSHAIYKKSILLFVVILSVQILLGIFTILYSRGSIPIWLGVAHQIGGLLLLSSMLLTYYQQVYAKK
ncbi:MAG: COX15/CtaA family protein [Saprospiraceae bacterium]|nr:COX15/CtaA family protein [Saprospiraceae bacterium]MBP7679634.1 COX15/CtaA family protein [Saprospiraceae bacterium]